MNKSMTWKEIKKQYPHQNVGLTDVKTYKNSGAIKRAVVKCSEKDTPVSKMSIMAINGEIQMRYTTLDEDYPITMGGIS